MLLLLLLLLLRILLSGLERGVWPDPTGVIAALPVCKRLLLGVKVSYQIDMQMDYWGVTLLNESDEVGHLPFCITSTNAASNRLTSM